MKSLYLSTVKDTQPKTMSTVESSSVLSPAVVTEEVMDEMDDHPMGDEVRVFDVEETKSGPEATASVVDGTGVSPTVNVIIYEGIETHEITIPRVIAMKFRTISDDIEDSPDCTDAFPLLEVAPPEFERIMAFYEQYLPYEKDLPKGTDSFTPIVKPIPSEKLEECGVPKWACEAVNLPLTDEPVEMIGRYMNLYKLFMAARYLNAEELLDVVSAKFAALIKSAKSPKAQRELWAIPNDFDSEDEFVMEEVEVDDEDEDGNPIKVKRMEKKWIKITQETHESFYKDLPV